MDKVLVVKAIEPNYNTVSGGPPIMMVGGGRSRGGPAVGRTKRERLGGLAGGTVGVLGALAGKHRSLGGLVQAMISGGAQGKALGGALGRSKLVGVGRQRQARADYDEEARRDYARMAAEGRFDRNTFWGRSGLFGGVRDALQSPATARRRVALVREVDELRAQQAEEAQARARAQAAAEGTQFGAENRKFAQSYRDLRESLVAAGVPEDQIDERMNLFNQTARNQRQGSVRVDPQPTSNNPTQGGNVGNVTVVDAGGNNLGNAQQMTTPLALQQGPPLGGANTEIKAIEDAGNTEAMQNGTDHERRSTVKVVNPNEEEEGEENEMTNPGTNPGAVGVVDSNLQRIQEREALERQQQGGN